MGTRDTWIWFENSEILSGFCLAISNAEYEKNTSWSLDGLY